jgi:dolichol-phosphate mannosyltransferase
MTAVTHFIIPIYNEAGNIGRVIADIASRFEPGSWRVVVVDDGSEDSSAAVLGDCAARFGPAVTVVTHVQNRGVPEALLSGFAAAANAAAPDDWLLCIEGDGTSDPALYEPIRARLADGCDVVIASRFRPGGGFAGFPLHRQWISRLGNLGLRLLFPYPGVTDFSIFYRGYRAALIKTVLMKHGGNAFCGKHFSANAALLLKCFLQSPRIEEIAHFYRYHLKLSKSSFRFPKAVHGYGSVVRRVGFRQVRRSCLVRRAAGSAPQDAAAEPRGRIGGGPGGVDQRRGIFGGRKPRGISTNPPT